MNGRPGFSKLSVSFTTAHGEVVTAESPSPTVATGPSYSLFICPDVILS